MVGSASRGARWSAVVVCALVTVLLPLTFPAGGGPDGIDRTLDRRIHAAFDAHPSLYRILVTPSDSPVVLGVLVLGVLLMAWRRRWRAAAFLAMAPELAVGVNEALLKPLWHRHLHGYLAYPSGHTFQLVAVATGFVLVAGSRRLRWIELVIVLVLLPAAGIGMVGLGYHRPTDVIGGACAAVAAVLALHALASAVALPGRVRG